MARAEIERLSAAIAAYERRIAEASDGRFWFPFKTRALIERARAHAALGQFPDAERDYQAAESLMPTDAALPFNRGLLRVEQGDLEEAITLCRAGWERANAAMRELMRAELEADPRYQAILEAVSS